MIKAIIFDIGGVILDMRKVVSLTTDVIKPKDRKKFWEEFNFDALAACRGEEPLTNVLDRLAVKYRKVEHKKRLEDLWINDYGKYISINLDMEWIIQVLRGKFKLGIISNSMAEHWAHIIDNKVFSYFDITILSHEIGQTKDNKEIFLLAAKKLDVKPEECIFIDDIGKFVEIAKSTGMKGIVFTDVKALQKDMGKFGISI